MKRRTIVLAVAGLLMVAACADDAEEGTSETTVADTTTTAGDTTTTAAPETTTTTAAEETTTSAAEEMVDGVHTADTDLGTILVDAEGFTLYVFTNDTGGESTCYDDCATNWPAVPGDTAVGPDLDAALFGTTARTDGSEQLTVNGQPLYRFAADAAPGDVNGQGVGGVWFVVGADGAMIEGPEASLGDDIDSNY